MVPSEVENFPCFFNPKGCRGGAKSAHRPRDRLPFHTEAIKRS